MAYWSVNPSPLLSFPTLTCQSRLRTKLKSSSFWGSTTVVQLAVSTTSAWPPDLTCLSQFLENPGIQHWNGFLHVLTYLKGTQDLGLVYSADQAQGIISYSDADWGNFQKTRCSVTGYLATFDGSLVLWKTQKQPTISLSTVEAEYKAVCNLASELLRLQKWCQECSLCQFKEPIPIYEDNQSCINVINGNAKLNNKCMKHVNIQLHFFKEVMDSSKVKLVYVPTKLMLADFLTKSVDRQALSNSLSSLGVLQLGVKGSVENCDQGHT
ncbi:hypothetical protein O181_076026 [Austropuccinia psidii MF-1]|uniref:Copia protein n=1 Tax=Austropuccinia psidii MF-1 TaxID=1389203 RepID=A0A9Q3F9L4_9BASI|nr:hypothetical protein [Austropuccinia psidii MF-1]